MAKARPKTAQGTAPAAAPEAAAPAPGAPFFRLLQGTHCDQKGKLHDVGGCVPGYGVDLSAIESFAGRFEPWAGPLPVATPAEAPAGTQTATEAEQAPAATPTPPNADSNTTGPENTVWGPDVTAELVAAVPEAAAVDLSAQYRAGVGYNVYESDDPAQPVNPQPLPDKEALIAFVTKYASE